MALECAVNASNPPPMIQWYTVANNNQLGNLVTLEGEPSFVESVQDGRYLYFSDVDMGVTSVPYTCVVTNARTNEMIQSGRIYTVAGNLPVGEEATFLVLDRTVVATVGEELILHISAAYGTTNTNEEFDSRCRLDGGSEISGIATRVTYMVPDPPAVNSIICTGSGGGSTLFVTTLNLTYVSKFFKIIEANVIKMYPIVLWHPISLSYLVKV